MDVVAEITFLLFQKFIAAASRLIQHPQIESLAISTAHSQQKVYDVLNQNERGSESGAAVASAWTAATERCIESKHSGDHEQERVQREVRRRDRLSGKQFLRSLL